MRKEELYELQKEMKKHLGDKWDLTLTVEDTITGKKDAVFCRYNGEEQGVIVFPADCERIFEENASIQEMGQYLAGLAEDNRRLLFTEPKTREDFCRGLYIQVTNAEVHRNLLKYMVHDYVTDDIVAVARYRGEKVREGRASFAVTREKMQQYHLSRGEVMEMAYQNTRSQDFYMDTIVDHYREMLKRTGKPGELELFDLITPPDDIGVYVLTTPDRIEGANSIVCPEVLQHYYEELKEPYFVMPSSVHEIMLVRESTKKSVDELEELLRDVNKRKVAPEEWLSFRVLYYDGKKLVPARERAEKVLDAMEHIKHPKRIP